MKRTRGGMTAALAAGILSVVLSAAMSASPASAQSETFRTYTCADGSQFAAAFYKYNPRFAHLQIDGKAIELKKRLSVSGARNSNNGITLRIDKAGVTTLKHANRPVTACSAS